MSVHILYPSIISNQGMDLFLKFNIWPPDLVFVMEEKVFARKLTVKYVSACIYVWMYTCIAYVTCVCLYLCVCVGGCLNKDIIAFTRSIKSGGQTPSFEFQIKFNVIKKFQLNCHIFLLAYGDLLILLFTTQIYKLVHSASSKHVNTI